MVERGLEVGEMEMITGGLEDFGADAEAGEEQFASHFAHEDLYGEGGDGEPGRAMQFSGQGAGEFAVGYGVGGGDIDGSGEGIIFEGEGDRVDDVVEVDPAPELIATAEGPADSETKDRLHGGEGAAFMAEDHTEAGADHAYSGLCGRVGCGFPSLDDLGQESGTGGIGFIQPVFSAVAVEIDSGGTDEDFGRVGEDGEGLGEGLRSLDTTFPDFGFDGLGPSRGGDIFTGEVNDGIEVDFRIQVDPFLARIPGPRTVWLWVITTDQWDDVVAGGGKMFGYGAADQSGGTCYQYVHGNLSGCRMSRSCGRFAALLWEIQRFSSGTEIWATLGKRARTMCFMASSPVVLPCNQRPRKAKAGIAMPAANRLHRRRILFINSAVAWGSPF